MVVICYLLECLIIYFWWKKILVDEFTKKDRIKNSKELKSILKKYLVYINEKGIKSIKISKDPKSIAVFKEFKKILNSNLYIIIEGIGYFVLIPIILGTVFRYGEHLLVGIIFGVAGVIIIISFLINCTPAAVSITKRFFNVISFMEQSTTILLLEKRIYPSLRLSKKLSIKIAIITIGVLTFEITLYNQIGIIGKDNSFLVNMICSSILIYVIILEPMIVKRKLKEKYMSEEKKVIADNIYFIRLEDDIREMCEKLKIEDIEFIVGNNSTLNAYALVQKFNRPKIIIEEELMKYVDKCTNGNEGEYKGIMRIIIGHELAHVICEDPIRISLRKRVANAIYAISYLIYILLISQVASVALRIVISIAFIVMLPFFKVMTDIRYWNQISELKADRVGMEISESEKEMFIKLWKEILNKINKEEEETKRIDESNLCYIYYKRYKENEAHPSIFRRIEMIEKHSEWRVIDYLSHSICIIRWLITKKGWNGR
ncbi:M48 family metalloprotease [Clostridium paraputrificum]|uniref:M48 family metalloprotease n=1 Tax=Clostridium paraputrificum TaxID=29363 RepID=UPI003D337BCC